MRKSAMFLPNTSIARPLAAAGILMLGAVAALAMGNRPELDDEGVSSRIQPLSRIEFAPVSTTATGPRTGEELVKAVCSACHLAGVNGAPKIGDKTAWAPRIAQGLDTLVKSATAGKNKMPPKGGSTASEFELTRAIVYMTGKSGGSFKEPAEAK
jgi:cytochrome c5